MSADLNLTEDQKQRVEADKARLRRSESLGLSWGNVDFALHLSVTAWRQGRPARGDDG